MAVINDDALSPSPFLTVIVPAFNEEDRIGWTMEALRNYLQSRPYDWEVLLVDDGSDDRTVEVAQEVWSNQDLRVIRQEVNRGKGAAIRRGMLEGRGQWRLFTDADNSTPIMEMEKFKPFFDEGYDVCIGSRALPDSHLEIRQPFYREMMGRCFNLFVRAIAFSGAYDTQCGFKAFSARAAQEIFSRARLDGWAFDVECLMIAKGLGYKIAEVPVRWFNSPATRLRAFTDSAQMFRDLVRLRMAYGRNGSRLKGEVKE